MSKMRVVLVVPPYADTNLEMACKESIGVCYLATVLRQHGIGVKIVDADLLGLSCSEAADRILEGGYDLIGFSVFEGTIESVEAILQLLEKGGEKGHLLLGGYFPTMMAREILESIPRVDAVVLGEAEFALLEVAAALRDGKDWRQVAGVAYRDNQQIRINPCAKPPPVDRLPFPDRDLLPEVLKRGGVTGIVGSRGCFEKCSFCCMGPFGQISGNGSWRGRSVSSICDELEQLVESWGVRSISFYDGNFIGPGKAGIERAYRIGAEIINRNLDIHFAISTRADQIDKKLLLHLKQAGLSEVFIGLESMTQRILDFYDKRTRVEDNQRALQTLEECRVYFRPGFILYEPHITLAEIRENLDFLTTMIDMHYCNKFFFFKALRVYRGSTMEQKLHREGILRKNKWHVVYEWLHPEVGEFIRITGAVCSQVVGYVRMIQAFDTGIRRYFETLLGKWNIQVHAAALQLVERGPVSQKAYLDLSVNAADELKSINRKIERYVCRSMGRDVCPAKDRPASQKAVFLG